MRNNPIGAAGEALSRRLFLKRTGIAAATIGVGTTAAVQAGTRLNPDDRIAAAMEEIKAAFAEKYPGWRIQEQNVAQKPLTMIDNKLVQKDEVIRHGILLFASSEKYGAEEPRWFVHHKFED